MPVLRTYRVRVDPKRLADYERFERLEGMPMVAAQSGCLACGFGRVRESGESTYVFYSPWETQGHLDAARSTSAWKRAAAKLETQAFSLGGDAAEHLDVLSHFAFQAGGPPQPGPQRRSPR